jgi:hypothetical protein
MAQATFSADTPSNPPPGRAMDSQDDALGMILNRNLQQLVTARAPHETIYRECFDHTYPTRGEGFQTDNVIGQAVSAMNRKSLIVDDTLTDAANIFAAQTQLGSVPSSARWFELSVFNADDQARKWLEAAADILHLEIHSSNFDSETPDCLKDLTAGWFVLFVDVDQDNGGGFCFTSFPIGQCYISSTRADGRIDTVYRKFRMTAAQVAQIAQQRGGKISEHVRSKLDTDPNALIDLCHAIEPRPGLQVVGGTQARLSKNKPFRSVLFETGRNFIIYESGFDEFPCMVPRLSRLANSHYGVGPVFDALPSARQLNELKRLDMAATEIAVGGLWKVIDDGVVNPRNIKIKGRAIIPVADQQSIESLTSGANFSLSTERIEQLQTTIRKIMMADQLQPRDGPQMTATEIHARVALIRQQNGPLYGRMQSEWLSVMVIRCFYLGFRAGIFGEPPDSLKGANFAVKYISPQARSQQLEDVTAIQGQIADVLQMAQIVPEVLDNYDWDIIQRTLGDARGVPRKTFNDLDKVMAMRDARAKQQAAEQAAQQQAMVQDQLAQGMAKAAGKKVNPNDAIAALQGSPPQGSVPA